MQKHTLINLGLFGLSLLVCPLTYAHLHTFSELARQNAGRIYRAMELK